MSTRTRAAAVLLCAAAVASMLACRSASSRSSQPTFASPDEAVKALIEVAKSGKLDRLMTLLGPEAQPLVDGSDPATARQHQEVFVVAAAEGWRLEEDGPDRRVLIVGHESWPFPAPLVKESNRWRFDGAAALEEVLARRIGRNELAAIRACRTYVLAQNLYARRGHDGKPAGLYATALRSDPGRQNGLYWPASRGEKRSPLGDLIADASDEGKSPFHGYHFRVLPPRAQSGFALIAWPASYDVTGVMTFIVNEDGVVRQQDLGSGTEAAAKAITLYNPDTKWEIVQ